MFDLGWSELVVIGIVALIAIGPKELPGVLRMAGQWMGKMRRMASEFQGQFQEAMREAEMADLKKQVDDLTTANPVGDVQKDIESTFTDSPPSTSLPAQATQPAEIAAPQSETPSAETEVAAVQSESPSAPTDIRPSGSDVHEPAAPAPQKTGEGA